MTWPSPYNAGTLGYMIDRIDDQLLRGGLLNSQIQVCINDAIGIYQRERFRFNQSFTATFQTVVGQQNYTAISDASFPSVSGFQQFYCIDWMTITLPPAVFDIPRIQPEELLILTQTGTQMGQPYAFAFQNETIMLYPVPSANTTGCSTAYTMTVGGHVTYAVPQSLGDPSNRWMTDGEQLIRSRALFELGRHYLRDEMLIKLNSPYGPAENGGTIGAAFEAFEMLKSESNRLTERGVIRPMIF